MPMLLHALPYRHRSRRRTRYLRTRILVAAVVLLLCASGAWKPWATPAEAVSPTASALPDAVLQGADPEESVDTEGALADRYIAER
ncbi:MAG: hypothetical protein HOP03_07440 [Lysobacter sp.]|nr:hypothetical protein [Lysobacter sp.]